VFPRIAQFSVATLKASLLRGGLIGPAGAISRRSVAVAAALLFYCNSGMATVVYDEVVSGDLPESKGFPVIPLRLGENTIKGSQFYKLTFDSTSTDFDSFSFTVPDGAHVTSITYEAKLTAAPEVGAFSNLSLVAGADVSGPNLGEDIGELRKFESAQPLFAPSVPLGPGTYTVYNHGLGIGEGDQWSSAYAYEFTVAGGPVPEPSGVLLMGIGFTACAVLALR
jgi:hypothetical protein